MVLSTASRRHSPSLPIEPQPIAAHSNFLRHSMGGRLCGLDVLVYCIAGLWMLLTFRATSLLMLGQSWHWVALPCAAPRSQSWIDKPPLTKLKGENAPHIGQHPLESRTIFVPSAQRRGGIDASRHQSMTDRRKSRSRSCECPEPLPA